MNDGDIYYAATPKQAEQSRDKHGAEPIMCWFGVELVVGKLNLDNGEDADGLGIPDILRAMGDLFGKRKDASSYVVTGRVRPDTCMSMLLLGGKEYAKQPELAYLLYKYAEGELEVGPHLLNTLWGRMLLWWLEEIRGLAGLHAWEMGRDALDRVLGGKVPLDDIDRAAYAALVVAV